MDFKYKIEFGHGFWIDIVATIDGTAGIELQKLIKSQFKYNLDRISGRPRLDRISLFPNIYSLKGPITSNYSLYWKGIVIGKNLRESLEDLKGNSRLGNTGLN